MKIVKRCETIEVNNMIEKNKNSNCNNDSNGSNGSNIDATTTNTNTTTNSTNPTNSTNTVADTVVDTGLMLFNNEEFGSVRVKMIDNEPWFVGKDVAVALGYAKPENAIGTHVELEDKTTTLIQGTGSNYKSKTVIINESGLYSLILSSKLESAKKFKKWVTGEVLPSIRKTGGYINDDEMFINTYLPNVDEQTRLLFKSNLMVIRDLNGKIDGLNEEVKGLSEKLGDKNKEIEGKNKEIESKAKELESKTKELDNKNKELTNKSKTIVNLSGEIIDLHEVIGAKDDIIGEKDSIIEKKDSIIGEKNKEIEDKDKELLRRNKVISKKSYAITKKNDMIAERDISLKEKEREIESKDREIESKNKIIEGKEKEIKSKDKIIETMTPKSEYYDNFMESEGLFSITTIAKQYGKSGKWMNEFLRDKGIQYKQNGTWCLYSKYCGKGYTENKGFVVRRKGIEKRKGIGFKGKISMYWTPKGKEFIDGLMREVG